MSDKQIDYKQIIINETLKCKNDPQYFIENYVFIVNKGNKLKFKLYDFQKDCVDQFDKHRFNIILKGRQLGLSELVSAYALWLLMFYNNSNVLIISYKHSAA